MMILTEPYVGEQFDSIIASSYIEIDLLFLTFKI